VSWVEEVTTALDTALGEGPAEGPAGGERAAYDEGFGPLTVTVPADRWLPALTAARDVLGCAFFDWLSAVDELEQGFAVVCHVARHRPVEVRHLLLRTVLPRESPTLASAVGVYAGAGWHERETTEMFGIAFLPADRPVGETEAEVTEAEATGGAGRPRHLLLPEEFEGHPLRKDFVLVSRVAKPWPGAKEPGESDEHGGSPSRRRTRPPGVPDEEGWGPREPGSPAPDPLAHARPGAARPRRTARERPPRRQAPEQQTPEQQTPEQPDSDGSQQGGADG
jgi:NADH-quinone oxidoreductase subunit C